jgi:beta-galactosidase
MPPLHAKAEVKTHLAEVRTHFGMPSMHVDGQPNAGMCYMTYRPKERYFRDFGNAGVDFVSFAVDIAFKSNRVDLVWLEGDRFDFDEMDERMSFILRANPEALIFPRVYLFAPPWWMDAHPDERMVYHDGTTFKPTRRFPAGTALPSWASEQWRRDAGHALRAMIRHIEAQSYGTSVVGYHLASGGTDEWYYYPYYRWFFGEVQEDFLDYGQPQTRAFRRWLQGKYGNLDALRTAWHDDSVTFGNAQIAPKEDKIRTDLFLLRDPARSQHVVDTLDFEAELIADTIAHFCRVVRDETAGRAFTGAFYGYLTGADDKGYCATHSLLQCPDLDFLTSPSAYAYREPGCGYSTDRTCLRSVQLHGKLWWDENDYYTYLTPEWKWVEGWTGPRDFQTTEVQQLRQLSNQVTHGMAGWWFDMEGGWFDAPEAMDVIERLNAIAERSIHLDRSSVAEVAVVVDEKSLLYVGYGGDLYRPLIMEQRLPFGRMGAPADWILMDDLDNAPDYRMYVFLNALHVTPDQQAALDRLAARGAKAVVWVYAPGLIKETLDVRNCLDVTGLRLRLLKDKAPLQVEIGACGAEALAGLPSGLRYGTERKIGPVLVGEDPEAEVLGELYGFGEPGLIRQEVGGIQTYFSSAPRLPAVLLRAIAAQAGVHIYNEQDDITYVNRSFIGLHTPQSGPRTLRFPAPVDLYDVYQEQVVAANARTVTLDLPARHSALYFRGSRKVWEHLQQGEAR